MKVKSNFKMGSCMTLSNFTRYIKSLVLGIMIFAGLQTAQAQDTRFTKPSWFYGGAVGANLNFYRGSTQELNLNFTPPTAFHKGSGVGLYLAPLLEYHRPDTRLGFMLQVGYDGRKGDFKQIITPCNCPADLSAKISYITVEPSLRLAPFKSDFYLYGGPRLAFNVAKSFKYQLGINPDQSDQVADPEVNGEFSKMFKSVFSMQIGAGYDIDLTSQDQERQAVLSPFISFQPYFNQDPRSIETLNLTTVRIGAALKFGKGRKTPEPVKSERILVSVKDPEVKFSVFSPANVPSERRVRETFPIRNYVFFDLKSTEISDRYVLITKDQVKDFSENRMEVFAPKHLSGRSQRQMTLYYNVLNILGDRMNRFPATIVRLTGASREGKKDGLAMAGSVKRYLVDVFGISPDRILTEGRIYPRIPSEQPGGSQELDLLRECDRRVSIWSESPEILMEFQTGPNAPLKPVETIDMQQAPPDSYVTFTAQGAKNAYSNWSIEVKDENGTIQTFGPYSQDKISIPGKSILGVHPQGNFTITMVGKTKSDKIIKKETSVHMVLWTPSEREEGMRFSVIFEFNDSKAISTYEKYLADVVTPKIPKGATVIIHGHTDIIGDEAHNLELSLARAKEVNNIISNALTKSGRTDVKFEVYGYGEDQSLAPFENKYPEERFYNRCVIIDIIPAK